MAERSLLPRLGHMMEAIERIRVVTTETDFAAFEMDWRPRMIVERGLEIISEASRHLPNEMKLRHPGIPLPRIAAIGNRSRHEYDGVLADTVPIIVRPQLACSCKIIGLIPSWYKETHNSFPRTFLPQRLCHNPPGRPGATTAGSGPV